MGFPAFYDDIPALTLYDPLAELLGAAEGGLIDYRFTDAVRLTGHACPTVAGAWLTGTQALRLLYGDQIPVRGEIDIHFHDGEEHGVTGVIASVLGLITGAAGRGGFKGLGGRYRRSQRLHYEAGSVATIRFTRGDTGAAVECHLDLSQVPGDPRTGALLGSVLSGRADRDQQTLFATLWQARVRRILLEHAQYPGLLHLKRTDP